jgi:hypothetical protein
LLIEVDINLDRRSWTSGALRPAWNFIFVGTDVGHFRIIVTALLKKCNQISPSALIYPCIAHEYQRPLTVGSAR